MTWILDVNLAILKDCVLLNLLKFRGPRFCVSWPKQQTRNPNWMPLRILDHSNHTTNTNADLQFPPSCWVSNSFFSTPKIDWGRLYTKFWRAYFSDEIDNHQPVQHLHPRKLTWFTWNWTPRRGDSYEKPIIFRCKMLVFGGVPSNFPLNFDWLLRQALKEHGSGLIEVHVIWMLKFFFKRWGVFGDLET